MSVAAKEAWEMTAETSKTLKNTHFTPFQAWDWQNEPRTTRTLLPLRRERGE
jgi:hypothetical protein